MSPMQGQAPPSRAGRGSRRFGATGNHLAAVSSTFRCGHRILGGPVAFLAGLVGLATLAGCGPEMFRQGVEDAALLAPGTGGAGGNPDDGTGGGGAGGSGGGGSCPQGGGGASGDASVPAFVQSWTFDSAADLLTWVPIGQPSDVVSATTVAFDGQDGLPCAGSARLTIPFAASNSQVAFGYNFSGVPQNFAGKVLTARVRLNSANAPGTIMAGLAYKSISGVYLFASSAVPTIVAARGWVTFSLSFDHPDGFVDTSRTYPDGGGTIVPDPTQVLEIDVLILTGAEPYITTDVSTDTVGVSGP